MPDWIVPSSEGGSFDAYLALPATQCPVPAVVLASAIHGVDRDLRGIADAFASRGYIAAAPDLFRRTIPGPLPRGDARAAARAQPRRERIAAGEQDLVDTRLALRGDARFNGRVLLMGFCYGGPYAVIGPARLGYDAGIACHGTGMLDVAGEARALRRPLCVLWGDRDPMAPATVVDAYRTLQRDRASVAVHLFPGVEHGYMMRDSPAFDPEAYELSMARALEMLERLALSGRSSRAAGTP